MSDLEKLEEGLRLYNLGEDVSLNHLRIKTEDLIDYYESIINELIGRYFSENDIIIECELNNLLFKARTLYTRIMDIINK